MVINVPKCNIQFVYCTTPSPILLHTLRSPNIIQLALTRKLKYVLVDGAPLTSSWRRIVVTRHAEQQQQEKKAATNQKQQQTCNRRNNNTVKHARNHEQNYL